ncbi:cobyrinic acid a,c-diamide synthase [Clostridium uliginosum]|uniref:Cobyrinic acid a,c-diamide synthase n=2 Tax=Clostridium uliginosum TaxID=119641 RepID=A0A1I1RCT8_9CLOT|nr:cobyrinate a,c-diamide synthase [Clostridium uliginosum]SFD29393.1 cobyrinic acid a,c-diamide synthase [Clostridium uliginosum]
MKSIIISSNCSGGGKTTFTLGLMKALKERGLKVQGYKVGPDYIDTAFHKEATKIPSRNLDTFLMGEEGVKESYLKGNGDIGIIEGVMGLYDGVGVSTKASTFDVSRTLDNMPIVLVLSPKGQSSTLCAEISGIINYRKANVVGVVLNAISEKYYKLLKYAIEKNCSVKVFGYIPKDEKIKLSSRHLGLIQSVEVDNLKERLEICSELVSNHVDLDGILHEMKEFKYVELNEMQESHEENELHNNEELKYVGLNSNQALHDKCNYNIKDDKQVSNVKDNTLINNGKDSKLTNIHDRQVENNKDSKLIDMDEQQIKNNRGILSLKDKGFKIGVALDEAFSFYYKDNLELLEEIGEIIYFSPIRDKVLPSDLDFLYIGGGYPEVFKEKLKENSSMRESIKKALNDGLKCYAECGGLMYLTQEIDGYEMVGFFDGKSEMTKSLKRFGYCSLRIDKKYFGEEININAHEFHKSEVSLKEELVYEVEKTQYDGEKIKWKCGYLKKNTLAGYAHINFLGNIELLKLLVD